MGGHIHFSFLPRTNTYQMPGVTVKDVNATQFIKAYARFLKKSGKVALPKWQEFAKTGCNRELAPLSKNWYFIRAASLARKIYLRPGSGVGGFSFYYGGMKYRNAVCGAHKGTSATGVLRSMLKQLEALGVVEKCPSGGRRITSKGRKDLDLIAGSVAKRFASKSK